LKNLVVPFFATLVDKNLDLEPRDFDSHARVDIYTNPAFPNNLRSRTWKKMWEWSQIGDQKRRLEILTGYSKVKTPKFCLANDIVNKATRIGDVGLLAKSVGQLAPMTHYAEESQHDEAYTEYREKDGEHKSDEEEEADQSPRNDASKGGTDPEWGNESDKETHGAGQDGCEDDAGQPVKDKPSDRSRYGDTSPNGSSQDNSSDPEEHEEEEDLEEEEEEEEEDIIVSSSGQRKIRIDANDSLGKAAKDGSRRRRR
jgi:hypothetical protein